MRDFQSGERIETPLEQSRVKDEIHSSCIHPHVLLSLYDCKNTLKRSALNNDICVCSVT